LLLAEVVKATKHPSCDRIHPAVGSGNEQGHHDQKHAPCNGGVGPAFGNACARPRGRSPSAAAARRTQRPTVQRRRHRVSRATPSRSETRLCQASPLLRPVIKAKLLARIYMVLHGTIRERVADCHASDREARRCRAGRARS
jgi:hypothetical protein